MAKEEEKKNKGDLWTWLFLIGSLVLAIYFIVDIYNSFQQIEELEGKYSVVCPNGIIQNFTAEGPAFLCGDILSPNPKYNHKEDLIFVEGNDTWQ